jgi:hypothetical protein
MNKLTTGITALALTAAFSFAAIAPASADQAAATRNEIIGGLALVAGIATAINVSNKNAEANAQYDYGNQSYYAPQGRQYNSNDGNGYRNDSNQYNQYNQDNGRRWSQNRR